jgi:adenylate cyclase
MGREADIHGCLERILANDLFAHAERQKRLLRYLVDETCAGRAEQLKGYTIGLEVFDRCAGFDPTIDAIVRVQAGVLRAKLREYYAGEGRRDPVRFELPKGKYAIRIEARASSSDPARTISPRPALSTAEDPPLREDRAQARSTEDKRSLAVLPFANMSSDPEQEYFADGITEDLITELSKISDLFVIARHSAFVYKGVAKRVQEIGQELGVRYLLEGSVRRSADRLRISAQLVDGMTGNHIWAERYDRELSEIFALQDEVTHSIVDALQLRLTSADHTRLAQNGTESIEAYELCRRGNAAYQLWTPDALDWAQDLYERAIAIDPSYAEPHGWLARVHTYRWLAGLRTRREESLDVAMRLVRRAVELDAELPLAHGVLSWVCAWSGLHDEAVPAARRAVALDPGGAETHYWLGVSLALSGANDEADRELAQAMRFNPLYPIYYLWARAQNYMFLSRYDQAIELSEQMVRKAPTHVGGYVVLGASYALAGRIDDARRIGGEMKRLFPYYCEHRHAIGNAYTVELKALYDKALGLAGI